ncbi:MAG: hypothetical protein KBH81_14805 [Phycisphaerae bacterium]|jgi:formamidopyrimidine-DNA glycosylase|nr:hypothetical protein [Phycisphaerae bacterium]HOO17979.1 hypothetical protein [Phycisphaerae bacterium]
MPELLEALRARGVVLDRERHGRVTIYEEALRACAAGGVLRSLQIASPFLARAGCRSRAGLRTVEPPVESVVGKLVPEVRRLGKRVVLALEEELFLALHLMIAVRFRWLPPDRRRPGKVALAVLGFESGTLVLTEAGSKKRAALHIRGAKRRWHK